MLLLIPNREPHSSQAATAAFLYTLSIFCFTLPPLTEWRGVVGLVLGLKAQILEAQKDLNDTLLFDMDAWLKTADLIQEHYTTSA